MKDLSRQEAEAFNTELVMEDDPVDEEADMVNVEEGTGLKSIMQEIIKNSNSTFDLTQYKTLTGRLEEKKQVLGKREPEVPLRETRQKKVKYGQTTSLGEDVEWEPPTDQAGDGKTKLNAKYGY